MKKAATIVAFVAGAAVGAASAWIFAKKKYEQIAQEEIDSVKEKFSYEKTERDADISKETDEEPADTSKMEEAKTVADYARQLAKEGYTNYSNVEMPADQGEEEPEIPIPDVNDDPQDKPYVIPPDKFDEFDNYDVISLFYYADGVLCDDNDEPLADVANTVGEDAVLHFGEYDDDCVYVRNDRLKVDYEILRSLKTYDEVLKDKPYLRREV